MYDESDKYISGKFDFICELDIKFRMSEKILYLKFVIDIEIYNYIM